MRVDEAVGLMTKTFLHRIIDSFTRDLPKGDEERSRDLIVRNVDELVDAVRVSNALGFEGIYSEQILLKGILAVLINALDHTLGEEELFEQVRSREISMLDLAGHPDCLKYEDSHKVEILRAVLEVALEDEALTNQELRLVQRLRAKLGLSERAKHIVLAQLGHFPSAENKIHTHSEFKEALLDLQRRGVLFYCNRLNSGQFVVPEELVPAVRAALGIEMSDAAWKQLLAHLSASRLSGILAGAGLPKSGTKEEMRERILMASLRPSASLEHLSNQDLYELCSSLPGAKVSGSKQERIDRVIDYFVNLVRKEVPREASPGEVYYRYLVELAARDRESLLANGVIGKDIDIERAFEEGTCFLMVERLGMELIGMAGSDHCDGALRLRRSGDLLMWDNKSKESEYDFPPAHLKQFKRYIRDSAERVSVFMVIGPEISPHCAENALRLKVESGSDTDVALISAEDLVWVAETWREFTDKDDFDPEVFNHSGILTRQILTQRMKLFL